MDQNGRSLCGQEEPEVAHSTPPWSEIAHSKTQIPLKQINFRIYTFAEITKLTEDESLRTCDSVTLQWWPSPDIRDNEYCIFLKEESRPRRHFTFKKPNQCDVDRSLRSDPYVTHSLCVQKTLSPETYVFLVFLVSRN